VGSGVSSGFVRTVGVEERRFRLARRHLLAPGARSDDVVRVARDLVALHSTDPASVYLAAWARLRDPTVAAVDRALYEDRSLHRMLGMRRTMFVVPADVAPVVQAACTDAIAARERRQLEALLERGGVADPAGPWLRSLEAEVMQALRSSGEALGTELSAEVPGLRERIHLAEGKSYGRVANVTTRVLFLMAAEGRIVRGRPRGSFASSQYRWQPAEAWLPAGAPSIPAGEARAGLVGRWLRAFGPGTLDDLRWWTGWTAGDVRRALAAAGAVEVGLGGGAIGLLLEDDLEPVAAPEPWVALVPALDPTVMGWRGRDWYLGAHGPALFDRSGNAGPTVWCDGRVVGGWAQRSNGEVVTRLLDDVGRGAAAAIEVEAARLAELLGDVRVTPRFRTPLERELST
jgi:Winged helix DNA-binding domain